MGNKFSSANIQQTIKTPNYLILCFCFFVVVLPNIFVWVFLGEFNQSKLDWLIAFNGNNTAFFNWLIVAVLFGILLLSLLIFFVVYFFKRINYDALPFILMVNVMCFSAILSGMIPYNQTNHVFVIVARFILTIVLTLITFFITNKFTNVLLLKSTHSFVLFNEYKKEFIEEANERKKFKKIVGNNKEKDYIEIDNEE